LGTRLRLGGLTSIFEEEIMQRLTLTSGEIIGCPTPQKGITTYSLSSNRQKPFGGAAHAAVFNTWRRFRHQVLYVVPPFIVAYAAMNWAIEK
jgi:ubiquinol-cytochrome c reductase subunit 8